MNISLRSALTTGITAVTATAVVAAPSLTPAPSELSAPIELSASTSALVNDARAHVRSVASQGPQLAGSPAPSAAIGSDAPAVQSATGDWLSSTYYYIQSWVTWGVEWAQDIAYWLGLPLIGNQIGIIYDLIIGLVNPFFDGFIQVLNDPLNLAVWGDAISNEFWGVVNALVDFAWAELGQIVPLPPPPPFPFGVAATAKVEALDVTPAELTLIQTAERLNNLSQQVWSSFDDPISKNIEAGLGEVSKALLTSGLPLSELATFELNETWKLIRAEGDATTGLPADLSTAGVNFVRTAIVDGLGDATQGAAEATGAAVVRSGTRAFNGVTTFVDHQLKGLTVNRAAQAKTRDRLLSPSLTQDATRALREPGKAISSAQKSVAKAVDQVVGGAQKTAQQAQKAVKQAAKNLGSASE